MIGNRRPSGTRARRAGIGALVALTLALLTGCMSAEFVPGEEIIPVPAMPDSPTAWKIDISDPEGPWQECLDDAAIANTSEPATRDGVSVITVTLVMEATAADADRISDCLLERLTGGGVAVSAPR